MQRCIQKYASKLSFFVDLHFGKDIFSAFASPNTIGSGMDIFSAFGIDILSDLPNIVTSTSGSGILIFTDLPNTVRKM
jgi:hypothetical protein